MAHDYMADCLIFDTLSDIYAGDESNRLQVRQFIGLLRGVCKRVDTTILALAHPSISGISSGSGTSGSTGWSNAVRARMYFFANGDGTKTLQVMKSNYGPTDLRVDLRWQNGLYVPVTADDISRNEEGDDMIFLKTLDAYTKQKRNVSPHRSTSYAPSVFSRDPTCGRDKSAMEAAMNRLFAAGRIKCEEFGPPSKLRTRLARVA